MSCREHDAALKAGSLCGEHANDGVACRGRL